MSERPPAGEGWAGVLDRLDADVRRTDEARWLASRFAPPAGRARLVALYAFNQEIARVRETVSDPLVGEIRLAWWREAIGEIYADPARARRHPVVQALAAALGADRPPRARFESLIDARLRDLDERSFADMAELADYAAATAGGLMQLAARLLARGDIDPAVDAGLAAAGRAWGLAGLASAFPVHAASGWVVVPNAPSASEVAKLVADRDAGRVRTLTAPLIERANAALAEARAALAEAPASLWPAFGYGALLRPRLREAARGDPFSLAQRKPGFSDRARLVIAAAAGAI